MRIFPLSIFIVLMIIGFSSCEEKQDYDNLKYIEVENKELRSFLIEYQEKLDSRGLISLDIRDYGVYLAYHQIEIFDDNVVAPLVYTTINNELIFIYSGIEGMLHSEKRYKSAIELLKDNVPVHNTSDEVLDIPITYHPPVGWLILCNETDVRYKEIAYDTEIGKHFNSYEIHPCIINDTIPLYE